MHTNTVLQFVALSLFALGVLAFAVGEISVGSVGIGAGEAFAAAVIFNSVGVVMFTDVRRRARGDHESA
jgi:hypothetical protein